MSSFTVKCSFVNSNKSTCLWVHGTCRSYVFLFNRCSPQVGVVLTYARTWAPQRVYQPLIYTLRGSGGQSRVATFLLSAQVSQNVKDQSREPVSTKNNHCRCRLGLMSNFNGITTGATFNDDQRQIADNLAASEFIFSPCLRVDKSIIVKLIFSTPSFV